MHDVLEKQIHNYKAWFTLVEMLTKWTSLNTFDVSIQKHHKKKVKSGNTGASSNYYFFKGTIKKYFSLRGKRSN